VILVVAATAREAELADGTSVESLVCGIGPVEAAIATARALAERQPDAILHIGVAGAQRLPVASLVIGSESVYCDVIDAASLLPRVERVEPDAGLLAAARAAVPAAEVVPIATAARVGSGAACEVEAMEGFGVLRAAALAGVPALELRSISNAVAERDRRRWRLTEALDALGEAVPVLVAAFAGAAGGRA
jgi:nucleoside phosphorylase